MIIKRRKKVAKLEKKKSLSLIFDVSKDKKGIKEKEKEVKENPNTIDMNLKRKKKIH